MWIRWFIRRFPARESRCRFCSPEEASKGAVPVQEANRLRSANLATSPTSAKTRAATTGPTPRRSINRDPRASTITLSSAVAFLILASTATSSASSSTTMQRRVLLGDVARTDAGEHHLGLQRGDVAFGLTRQQFGEQGLEPVDGLNTPPGQRFASVGEHPQRLELPIDLQDTQSLNSDSNDRDRVRIKSVGLAVVPGVEKPDPGSELRRDVDHLLASLEQPLGQGSTSAVGALNRPDPLRPRLRVPQQRRVAGLIGREPTPEPRNLSRSSTTSIVADSLWGSTPIMICCKCCSRLFSYRRGRRGGQCYYEQGSPLLSHASSTVPDGLQTGSEPHPHASGQPKESEPAGHLDRVWPDTGPAASL